VHSADRLFAQLLLKKLGEEQQREKDALANGMWVASAGDIARIGGEYLRRMGYLKALQKTIDFIDEVEMEMNKRD
jgi:hypothetical protein